MMRALVVGLLFVAAIPAFGGDAAPLDAAAQAKWLKAIAPSEEQRAWRAIGWRTTLWDAVVAAHAEKKPILLWAMNGHPLGCT